MHGLMQAKGWRWAAWRHRGGKGAAEHKIRMLECLWRRGRPLCGNQEWWLFLLTVVAQVSAKHGNVVEIRGGRSWSKPGFREGTPLWIRQPGQPCSSVHPKYLEIQVDVGRIGGVMHMPRDG